MSQHLDDERLSALADGGATGAPTEGAEHVAICPECARRLGGLRAAAELISTRPAPPDAVRREQAIAAALVAAHDEGLLGATGPGAEDGSGTVTPMTRRRRTPAGLLRPAGRPSDALRWIGAAAAVITALVMIGSLFQGGDTLDTAGTFAEDDAALERDSALDGADGDSEDATASDLAPAMGAQEAAPGDAPAATGGGLASGDFRDDLGAFDELGPLVARLEELLAGDAAYQSGGADPATAGGPRPDGVTACVEATAGQASSPGEPILTASVQWQGTAAAAVVRRLDDPAAGRYRLWVLGLPGCTPLTGETF